MPSMVRLYAIGISFPKVASSLKKQVHSVESQSAAQNYQIQSIQGAHKSLAAASQPNYCICNWHDRTMQTMLKTNDCLNTLCTQHTYAYAATENQHHYLVIYIITSKKQHGNKILRQRYGSTFPSLQTSCLCAAALAAACAAAALTGFWGSLETEQPTDLPIAGKNQTKGLSAPPLLAHRCNHMRLHTLAAHSQTCPPPAWLLTSVPDSQWCHTCRY